MRRSFGLLLLCLAATLCAQEFVEPFHIDIHEQFPQGTIHQGGDTCQLAWQVADAAGTVIPPVLLENKFQHLALAISQVVQGKETTIEMHQLNIVPQEYQWQLPKSDTTGKYWFMLEAIAKGDGRERASGRFPIYVREFRKETEFRWELDNSVQLLMDWHGRRGYYTHTSPVRAWQRATEAVAWMRKNLEPGDYHDYVKAMEKVESTRSSDFTIYCPVNQATLRIDHWLVGFFQEWDQRHKMFVLRVTLPIDREMFYTIHIAKGNQRFSTSHTHASESECMVAELYNVVSLVLTTPALPSQAAIEGRKMPDWHTRHVLEIYRGKSHTAKIAIKNGPLLKVFINAKDSMAIEIVQEGENFFLQYDKRRYEFIANEVNLLNFER
jgi:hypothetical protein